MGIELGNRIVTTIGNAVHVLTIVSIDPETDTLRAESEHAQMSASIAGTNQAAAFGTIRIISPA